MDRTSFQSRFRLDVKGSGKTPVDDVPKQGHIVDSPKGGTYKTPGLPRETGVICVPCCPVLL